MTIPDKRFAPPPRIPMKYVDGPSTRPVATDAARLQRLIRDPQWIFEQKFDGTRGLVVISSTPAGPASNGTSKVWWPGRNGRASLAHTAATQHFSHLNPVLEAVLGGTVGEIVLDGEIMTGTGEFMVFDAPYMRFGGVEVIRPTDPFHLRRKALDAPDFLPWDTMPQSRAVKVVRQARTAQEKRQLLDAVMAEGGEGVMAKHVDHPYSSGERAPESAACKIKLVKTADVVITEVDRPDARHGNCRFGVFPLEGTPVLGSGLATPPMAKNLIPVGGCSLIGKPQVAPGDVVEVEYLYFMDGGQLYQPRLKRVREDKSADECLIDQFRTYSRRAV